MYNDETMTRLFKTKLQVLAGMAIGICMAVSASNVVPPDVEHSFASRRHQGIPSIAASLVNGRLWCTWYGGPTAGEDANNYVVLATSGDGGETWREVLVADPDGKGPRRAFDPEVWLDADGKIRWVWTERLAPVVTNGIFANAGCEASAAKDELWLCALDAEHEPSAAHPPSTPRHVARGIMMGKPETLPSGERICPVANWREDESSSFYLTRDGFSFVRIGGAGYPRNLRCYDEHQVVRLADGTLKTFARLGSWKAPINIGEAVSCDGGCTWTKGMPGRIPHTSSRFFVTRLNTGNLLLVKHGPIDSLLNDRRDLTAYVSHDGGETWKGGLLLDARKWASYPDGQQLADGRILVVYDFDRTGAKEICFAEFTEADVLAGRDVSGKVRLRRRVSGIVPPQIKAIESRAAAYARMSPDEQREMWNRTMRAAAEFELMPPQLQTNVLERYTHAKLDFAMNCGVTRTPKGRLWAVWVGGEDGPKSFVVGCWSDDGGRTWTDTRLVVDSHRASSDWDLLHVNLCHQVANVWCSPDGRLRFFVYQSAGIFSGRGGTWEFVCENPDDAHPRWSEPRYMFPGGCHNKPIVLRDGTWIYFNDYEPYGRENFPELEPFMGCGIYATRDGNILERRGFTRPEGTWHWAEHMAVERSDGTLWMLLRTGKGLMESFSKDKGFTWTTPAPPHALRTCVARFVFLRLASGRLLFVKNGTAVDVVPESREKLSAFLSDDEGATWKGPLVLDARTEVAYPDAFQFPDGAIGLTYDRCRRSDAEILFARFTEDDIRAGEIRTPGSFLRSVVVSARAAQKR